MDHSGKTAKRQARSTQLAERHAFEGYLRWGRASAPGTHQQKAARPLSAKALGDVRPTSYYTWRTAHDERVRPSHAANEGRVFAWSDPPALTGHPGHDPNCRCTAEPYYGTPYVSDASLPLTRQGRTDATGQAVWQSIETLTRPDGSLAQSTVLMRDATTIRSTFNGPLVVNNVTLPDGRSVRLERNDGVQSVYVGNGLTPVVQSVWTADGPRIGVLRRRVALAGPLPLDLMPHRIKPDLNIFTGRSRFSDIEVLEPDDPLAPDLGAGGAAIGLALLALYLASQTDRASLGAGTKDEPALTIRIWTPNGKLTPFPVSVTSLTAEEVTRNCKRLPEVQMWTDFAVMKRGPRPADLSPATYGTYLHTDIETMFKSLKENNPLMYADTFSERSYDIEAEVASRASNGSSRLDIIEIRDDVVCIYDIKTGDKDMQYGQLTKYSALAAAFGKKMYYIIQVKPSYKFPQRSP